MKSIIQTKTECYVCGKTEPLHLHHVMDGTANRKKSDKWGLWVYLCPQHHNLSSEGVHFNHTLDTQLKQKAQYNFELLYGHDLWMREFHKNYL